MSEAVQLTIVGLIILAACGWALWRFLRPKKGKGGACSGCALSETCAKKKEGC